jgi:hypothetical protein
MPRPSLTDDLSEYGRLLRFQPGKLM